MSTIRSLAPVLRRRLSTACASLLDPIPWTQAPVSRVFPAAESLFHVCVDVSHAPRLASSHTRAGQYLQLRAPGAAWPTFLAIASPPARTAAGGEFEFLVSSVPGSTAERLCRLKRGDLVELSAVMGEGFDVDRIEPPEDYPTVLMFATGSGISPIRSLIESGFDAARRSDVRVYYGALNLRRMAYQDRFKYWESSGIEIIPVLSEPDCNWIGEAGNVQAAFSRARKISSPFSTGAVICGHRQMREEVTSILVKGGVQRDKILTNY
ncbi:hypothetical protein SAY87_015972 [Trapa incisa]|uniref:FAD-binding FR-type domain-containing protein n=2 Tax=Trapa TaxID=22665 RepID=A0AAN7LE18_TRANT|nr:hypothetical protein SAY87_015972 [Trapa incisa]KAK4786208.1 hypothetical protein SAY86_002897 [Trapa natans]